MGVFRMTAVWADAVRRVTAAPALLGALWLITMLVSMPLALGVRDAIDRHLGASLEAESAAAGANFDWMQEFGGQASGLTTTFGPAVIGFAAVLDNLSAFVENDARPAIVASAAAIYLGAWVFLTGGIIDRYARDRVTRVHEFFSACGVFFFRFLRLGAAAWIVYAILFGVVHPYLFQDWYPWLTRDVTVERQAFFIRLSLYAAFGALLAAFNLLFDYAKVRAVVEDRRSMTVAFLAAVRFVKHNPSSAAALYLMNTALFALVLMLYALIAPGTGAAGASMWLGFAIGQAYVIARLWVKLIFWASETALFQSRLAHAGYVARPQPVWPESPAAEALTRM